MVAIFVLLKMRDMRKLILLLCLLPTALLCLSQNKGGEWDVYNAEGQPLLAEKRLTVCYVHDEKRVGVKGVIQVAERVDDLIIQAFFDNDAELVSKCRKQKIGKYRANCVKINDNIIYVGDRIADNSIARYIPTRILYAETETKKYIVLEMSGMSQNAERGVGFCYILVRLNMLDEVEKQQVYEYGDKAIDIQFLFADLIEQAMP